MLGPRSGLRSEMLRAVPLNETISTWFETFENRCSGAERKQHIHGDS